MYAPPNRLLNTFIGIAANTEDSTMESNHKEKQLAKEAGITMEQTIEEAQKVAEVKRAEKRAAEEPGQLAKEQARKEAWLAKEKAIEETQRLAEARRAEKRAAEEAEQLAKEQARKEIWLARERAIEEAQKARKAIEMKPDNF